MPIKTNLGWCSSMSCRNTVTNLSRPCSSELKSKSLLRTRPTPSQTNDQSTFLATLIGTMSISPRKDTEDIESVVSFSSVIQWFGGFEPLRL